MLYSGYFRNIDTTNDPQGQLYKVEVFTDGVLYTYNFWNIPQEQELLLSDSPFVVEYDSDNNKYKSYKGSTASIGIMMDNYGFISKGKCDIFVRLLKYKNEVVLNDNHYTNTITQEELYKKHIAHRYMFVPAEVDDFCYEVEWVGYATPQVYSQDYTRVQEEYVLECQDILTTLQYFEYNSSKRGTTTFKDSITEALNTLPVQPINNIYVTNTKRIPSSAALIGSLSTINDNWINESYERNNCLDVLDNLMTYLGMTIIQHKDNFYITTPDAIASGMKFYYKYDIRPLILGVTLGGTGSIVPIINFPNIGWHLLGKNIEISDGELATNSTRIGTTNTYKRAVITTDEFYDSNLITDIDNDDILEERFRWDDIVTYLKLDDVDRNYLSHQYPYNYDMVPATSHYSGSVYDILTNDVADTNNASLTQYYYQRDTESTTDSGYSVQYFTTVAAPVTVTDMFNKVGCSVVDFSAADINDNTTQGWMESYQGQRAWLFHNTYAQVGAGLDLGLFGDVPVGVVPLMLDPTKLQSASYAQTVLSFKSKKVFMRTNQSINITGNLEFFQTVQLPLAAGWSVEELMAYKPYMFIWCRLKIHNDRYNTDYYVTNGTSGYTWTTTPTWFKLYYDNNISAKRGGTTSVMAFENMFCFNKNTRGAEGTCIELPSAFDGGEFQQIEFDMKRPWGCGREEQHTDEEHFYPAQYTVMTNFKINVIDTSETVYRYEAEENNQFKVNVNDLGVDDFETSLLVSSDYYKNTSKATVIGLPDDLCVEDRATGSALFPEANYILNTEKSYATSKLRLDVSLPYEVSPLDRVTWVTQINDKNFSIDQMSIDYAYNRYSLSLIECTLDEVSAEIFSEKRAKNFRRNGDNLYNPLPKRNKKRVNDPTENEEYDATFNVNSNRVQLLTESDTLLKHLFFEPTNVIELLATNPDYTDVEYEINNQGEIIITYNI